MIKVLVGEEPCTTFMVHEKVICASSAFFKVAMRHQWKESKERTVHLEEDKPEIFLMYINWLYNGTIPIDFDEPDNNQYLRLAQAYVLGDKLRDGDFCDAVVDAIIDGCQHQASDGETYSPGAQSINYIYENLLSSPAKRLLVDIYAFNSNEECVMEFTYGQCLPRAFLYSLAMTMRNTIYLNRQEQAEADPFTMTSTCIYHEHGENTKCYKERLKLNKGVGGGADQKTTAGVFPSRPRLRGQGFGRCPWLPNFKPEYGVDETIGGPCQTCSRAERSARRARRQEQPVPSPSP
jgi:hypothetical protein